MDNKLGQTMMMIHYHYLGDGYDDEGDEYCDGDDAHAISLGTEVASNAWLEDESYMTVVPAVLGLGAGDDSDDEESEQYFSIFYLSFFASQVI